MIHSLTSETFSERCEGCGNDTVLSHDGITAGNSLDHRIIELPVCSCGMKGFLNRTHDNPGTHAHLVNSLHEHLVLAGRVHEAHRDRFAVETEAEKPTNRAPLTNEPLVPPEPFDPVAFLNGYLADTPLT